MSIGKVGVSVHCFCGCLTNNDQAHDDGLLSTFVRKELTLSQSVDEGTRV